MEKCLSNILKRSQRVLFLFFLVAIIHNLAKFGYNQDMKIKIFNHPSIFLATYWKPPIVLVQIFTLL
jgi:hypothetical protein